MLAAGSKRAKVDYIGKRAAVIREELSRSDVFVVLLTLNARRGARRLLAASGPRHKSKSKVHALLCSTRDLSPPSPMRNKNTKHIYCCKII